jgi:hypothetical protein
MAEQKIYTLEEVNSKIPSLRAIVGRQLSRRAAIEEKLTVLGNLVDDIPDDFAPSPGDSDVVRELKTELTRRVAEYRGGWDEVEDLGAVIKDPQIGLVDFYGRLDGNVVWLCWKYGEDDVAYYHALDAGFAGRKPIGATVRQRLLN